VTSQGLWFSVLKVCWKCETKSLKSGAWTNPFITGQAFCVRSHDLPCNISGQEAEHNEGCSPQHDSQMVGRIAGKKSPLGFLINGFKGLRPRNLESGVQVVYHRLASHCWNSTYTWVYQTRVGFLAQGGEITEIAVFWAYFCFRIRSLTARERSDMLYINAIHLYIHDTRTAQFEQQSLIWSKFAH
jgi:hypothetical protein